MKKLTVNAVEALLKEIRKDPLADWMRSKGEDPDKGALMVIPDRMRSWFEREDRPWSVPEYVRFSAEGDYILLVPEAETVRPDQILARGQR